MNISTHALKQKTLSAFLTFALAFTLMPLPAMAYADEADQAKADEATQIEDATTAEVGSSAADAVVAAATGDTAPVLNVTTTDAASAPTIVHGSVALGSAGTEAAAPVMFAYDGLNYITVAEGEAALIGWATQPTGDITVPSEVVSGNTTYAVTNINSGMELRGGGPRLMVKSAR